MHLSAIQIDKLALGALTHEDEAAARVHLASCARCRRDHDAAASLRAHFTVRVFARTVPRRHLVRWWFAVPALTVAAAIAVMLRPHPPEVPALAIKGEAAWQVFANRDDQTFPVHDGTLLAAGDRVRFVVTPEGARFLLVVSVDGAGQVSTYYPYGGERSGALESAARVELPGSIVLDAAPGPERVFALFSDEPIEAASVTDPLRAIGAGGPIAIRAARSLAIATRAQATLVFEKATP